MTDVNLESELKILIKKRETSFARLNQIYEIAKRLDQKNPDKQDLKKFALTYPGFRRSIEEIEDLDWKINRLKLKINPDEELSFTAYQDLVDIVEYIAVLKLPKAKESSSERTEPELLVDSKALLRKLDIPEFSGSQDAWPVFSQLFSSMVDKNPTLTDLHKVSLLVSKLSGPALKIVEQIPPTGENYKSIRDLIWSRFDDPTFVVENYLDKIFNFNPCKVESKENLERFLDVFNSSVTALERLNLNDLAGRIFLHQALKVLDYRTRREFEATCRDKPEISFNLLVKFIENQLRLLRSSEQTPKYDKPHKGEKSDKKGFHKQSHALVIESAGAEKVEFCQLCQMKGHKLLNCRKFLKLSPWERFSACKKMRVCLKCFSNAHPASSCDKGPKCKECNLPHDSLLHFPFKSNSNSETVKTDSATSSSSSNICAISKARPNQGESTVILSTAQVKVIDGYGRDRMVRMLIDSGSQCHFLTTKTCQRLSLPIRKLKASVLGIGDNPSAVHGKTCLTFTSRFDPDCKFTIEPLVVEKIVERMPSAKIDLSNLAYLKQLKLADDEFATPSEIDGIIGAELVPYLLTGDKIVRETHQPVAMHSPLGFIVVGKAPVVTENGKDKLVTLCSLISEDSLPELLERFWSVEEVPKVVHRTEEEKNCEEIYSSTVSREKDGRYVVALPFKVENPQLGESYKVAERRLFNLEKTLEKNLELKVAYHQVLKDYVDQGHLSLVENPDRHQGYFIPHHCVHKASTSTPVRVVFDASAKGSLGLSLNDNLYTGPKLQADIFSLLVNFRLFKIGLSADIKQMYRQIQVREVDRNWQQILWRFSKDLPVQVYRHNTVVFGLSSSPFLALRTLQQVARDEGDKFQVASRVIPHHMYMDDLVTSVETLEEASELHVEAKRLLALGGFKLVKWSSNLADLIPNFTDRIEGGKEFETSNTLPVLGLVWNPEMDNFYFKLDLEKRVGTKRSILSTIARIYDPLGFLAPVILFAKVLIQELWKEKSDWDQEPSSNIAKKWNDFQNQLVLLTDLKIPRFVGLEKSNEISLIGFCDASLKGFGAVIYLLVVDSESQRSVRLLCAKSKVAPSKMQTIPRLELLAAVLLANLMKCAYEAIKDRKPIKEILAFSDSEIVLCWLNASPPVGKLSWPIEWQRFRRFKKLTAGFMSGEPKIPQMVCRVGSCRKSWKKTNYGGMDHRG